MSRNPEYQFVSTDTDALVSELVAGYEKITKTTVRPASPEKLFIQWVASVILQERVWNNYTGNQNIPSRATGDNLDSLGELFYETNRPQAKPAVCTMRFHISEAQNTSILVPAGTRVTDNSGEIVWQTKQDAYVPIGETFVDVPVQCATSGVIGNGYAVGQITSLIDVDVIDYYARCENITVSDDGADKANDEDYYTLMRTSMDGYSCAGARGAYIYIAKKVSTEIADVLPNCPAPGCVNIYLLMDDGSLATQEMKNAVLDACSAETARPLTDLVSVADAEQVRYNISFTYYIQRGVSKSATEIEAEVANAVQSYVSWQCGKFGRDIVPDRLREYLYGAGIKRITLNEPRFTVLRDGMDNTVPQVASVGEIEIINGGYEDE